MASGKARKATQRRTPVGNGYRIGTVSSLTGLDPNTIRAWERRHGVVEPSRSEGRTRFYSDSNVERLRLVKAVTDCGDPIGRVAHLSNEALRDRLAKLVSTAAAPQENGASTLEARPIRVALLDPGLAEQLRMNAAASARLEVVVAEPDPEAFLNALVSRTPDVLALAIERMTPDPAAFLERCLETTGARLALVTYRFARRQELERLADRGAKLLRGPVRAPQIQRSVLDLLVIEEASRRNRPTPSSYVPVPGPAEEVPDRRYSDDQLARLREVVASVDCECPNHLSSLVESLVAFERYSRGCESASDADAALHARLASGTAHARSIIEGLLTEVCELDRIHL